MHGKQPSVSAEVKGFRRRTGEMVNQEGVGESRLIWLVRKWRPPLLLLLTGLVALDVRGAMGIAANLTYAACIGNAADASRRIEACTQIIDNQAGAPDKLA
ncbi:MAG: hypothetical protein E5V40_23510, partial [Mesorhizobium sp.]